jgi:hypothetical protein
MVTRKIRMATTIAAISPVDSWRWGFARADETLLGPASLGPFVKVGLLIREGEPEMSENEIVWENGLLGPMFLTWGDVAIEREVEPEIMTAL